MFSSYLYFNYIFYCELLFFALVLKFGSEVNDTKILTPQGEKYHLHSMCPDDVYTFISNSHCKVCSFSVGTATSLSAGKESYYYLFY